MLLDLFKLTVAWDKLFYAGCSLELEGDSILVIDIIIFYFQLAYLFELGVWEYGLSNSCGTFPQRRI